MSKFLELPNEKLNIPVKHINQSKLDLDINDFYDNDVIIIKSGTATGKTRNIGKLSKDLKEKYNCNILSVVNLISLSREQITTFYEESKISLKNYQTGLSDFAVSDGVICINSLYKLEEIKDFNMENTILYIDEVNDLIRSLTHNDALDKVLNLIYTYLIKLIKSCKKIILSDATIDQNTLNLLSSRITNNKTILINNSNKTFEGIDALKYNDETEFINEIRNHIKNKKYFLFGCDCCAVITKIYTSLIGEFKEQKDDFILITGETTFRPTDVKKEFKNKYVFYSPSITTGVSFVYEEIKQTQFIYISKKPLITPISIYQMSSRTRNMDKLYYYSNQIKDTEIEYETVKEVENKYKKLTKLNEKVLCMSKSINENDEIKIVENTFFKLFCYNEYQDGIFNTGYLQHFENILRNNGFNLKETGVVNKLAKEEQQEFNEVYELIKDEEFNDFINLKYNEIEDEEDAPLQDCLNSKYKNLNGRCNLLNIPSKEEAEKYKVFLTDEYALRNYFNLLTLFRTDQYIKLKNQEKLNETFKIKNLSNVYNKLSLLKTFEKHYKINRFDFVFENVDVSNEISEKFQTLYKNIFPRLTVKSFSSKYELIKIYVNIIKNICGDIPLIKTKKAKENKKSIWKYHLDIEMLKDLIILLKHFNPELKNYNIEHIETLTQIKPEPKKVIKLVDDDDDDMLNDYLFNKITYKAKIVNVKKTSKSNSVESNIERLHSYFNL